MKKCRVAILGWEKSPVHRAIAFSAFSLLSQKKYYTPQVLLCDRAEQTIRNFFMLEVHGKYDVVFSIGTHMTETLACIYKNVKPIPTVFAAAPDPVKIGAVESLENPGGFISGVTMAQPSMKVIADKMSFCYPYVSKLFIPYDPSCLSGLLSERVEKLIQELQAIGFEIKTQKINSLEEALNAVAENLPNSHGIVLLEGCTSATGTRQIAYLCNLNGRLLFSNNGRNGIFEGAAFSDGCPYSELVPKAVEMIENYWINRVQITDQPVIFLPNNRVCIVNKFILAQWIIAGYDPLGDSVNARANALINLQNRNDIVVENIWVEPPTQY